jgi:hypothetical protein
MSNANLRFITSAGTYNRSMILQVAHRLARKFRHIYDSYAQALSEAMRETWIAAWGELAIYQTRTGQTREYVRVARDVMLPA